ncbi:uncharacterized protein LOC106754364 [Vigna radiata var. radiata]|uniref:Uncharacterized protein LOC106754364 n=1 Tax=Vigna radiata var. radiata TaxID=3916 RepID=A0A1S3TDM7_VIGRR|nr:uncharacterized protein LOC106754364 [Vigna radiata var. radiata]
MSADLFGEDTVKRLGVNTERPSKVPLLTGGQFNRPQLQPPPLWQHVSVLNDRTSRVEDMFEIFLQKHDSTIKRNEASFRNLEMQISQLAKRLEHKAENQFGANTEVNLKENCKAIVSVEERVEEKKESVELVGREEKDEKICARELERDEEKRVEKKSEKRGKNKKDESVLPYRKRCERVERRYELFREIFNQMEIKISLTEALQQIPVYARHIKHYLGEKIDSDEEANDEQGSCSDLFEKAHPPKVKDPGGFTVPCTIGSVKIGKALLDLGSSINMMPLSIIEKIGGLRLKPTNISLIMVDGSPKKPYSFVEDVVMRIGRLKFLVDFVVMEMKEDDKIPIILGRLFMKAAKVFIIVEDGLIMIKD